MSFTTYSDVWELDSFFEGGSESADFSNHIKKTAQFISLFEGSIKDWSPSNTSEDAIILAELISKFQKCARMLRQAGAFVSCLQAQDTSDKKANNLRSYITELSATFLTALTLFDHCLT